MQNLKPVLQKKAFLILMVPSICLCFVYKYNLLMNTQPQDITYTINATDYLVFSSHCRIPNVEPLNSEVKSLFRKELYQSCHGHDVLTYVTKNINGTEATLHIDENAVHFYAKNGITCCIRNVTRLPQKSPKYSIDNHISLSKCTNFKWNVSLPNLPVLVKCSNDKGKKTTFQDVHAPVIITKSVQEKIARFDKSTRPLSVLLVGLDSISRLNMMRSMPRTRTYFEENGWLEMQGYNKMGDNTFPNVMAMLTGHNYSSIWDLCDPTVKSRLDNCSLIWFDYSKRGYITGYGEDQGPISTFNYHKLGFTKPPTDYYFRPYVLASEKLNKLYIDDMLYCTGPFTATERIFKAAEDFAVTFKDAPNMGFFWINQAHQRLNSASRMDRLSRIFLKTLKDKGVLDNSIVIFLSDHGLRFGKILYTYTGWLEERLPMLYIWVPKWFRETYPLEYDNMRLNANKLTNPYDVYMTLQDILVYASTNYTVKPSNGCPKCQSLFSDIPSERSCEDASIDIHWCACSPFKYQSKTPEVMDAARFIIDSITNIISKSKETKNCAKYKLNKVITSRVSENGPNWYKNDTYYLIILETTPSATFEATVKVNEDSDKPFSLQGGISRLDEYKKHASCVDSAYLKLYCYCH